MFKLALPALLVMFCLSIPSFPGEPAPVRAEDDAESKATDRRPINDRMTLDEARAAIDKAAGGDEEALQKLKDGRLAYVPVLIRDRRTAQLAYSLLRDDIDWVRDMQRWEIVLGSIDPRQIEEGYRELADRFHHAEGQLARAYIKVWQLGDRDCAARLAALIPNSRWVEAARAWVGEISDPARRVDVLLELQEETWQVTQLSYGFMVGLLDDEVKRLTPGTTEFAKAEVQLFYGAEGVGALNTIPVEWMWGAYFEKLGILTHDLPRKQRNEVASRIAKVTDGALLGSRYTSFAYGAFYGEKQSKYQVNFALTHVARCTPCMAYAENNYHDQPLPRRVSAISAFWGAPDWAPAQDLLLKEAVESGDETFLRLAIRAVLCANDDRLRAVNSVARALRSSTSLDELAKSFAKALKDSKHKQLQSVAAWLQGSGTLPPDNGDPVLQLSQAQKSALLKPFLYDDEIIAYGGEQAAYLMNLSQFLFAQHRLVAAMEAAALSIETAANGSKRRLGQANAFLTHRTLRLFLGNGDVSAWLESWQERFPLAVGILREHAKAQQAPSTEPEAAGYAIERQFHGGEAASEAQREALAKDVSLAGGFGLCTLSLAPGNDLGRKECFELREKAELATPSDLHLYFQMMHRQDWFGRFAWRDWAVAEHLIQCLSLLQPYNWNTFSRMGALLARAGCDPRCMSPLLTQALDRPIQPYTGDRSVAGLRVMLFNRSAVSSLLRANAAANDGFIKAEARPGYTLSLERMAWGLDWWDSMCWGPRLSPRPGFTDACFDFEYNARDRENVGILLDYALELQGVSPGRALKLVDVSEQLGVSAYGHFVGSQTYIRAKAQQGDYPAALKRWRELRDGDVGVPAYLDYMLLHGLLEGNQWKHIGSALDEILQYKQNEESVYLTFALRRAFMAAGRHAKVSAVQAPDWKPDTGDGYEVGNYTEVFYEARRLFERGQTAEITKRATQLWSGGCEHSIGVILDAVLLSSLAGKLQVDRAQHFKPDQNGMLHAIVEDDLWWFQRSHTLDYMSFEILAGRRKPGDLPPVSDRLTWHGLRFGERPQQFKGSGFLREGEALARDHFVRGVIAFLADDEEAARAEFKACVEANQRCSHEYHVAEWMLDKQLPKAK